jgi:hypothetical protein
MTGAPRGSNDIGISNRGRVIETQIGIAPTLRTSVKESVAYEIVPGTEHGQARILLALARNGSKHLVRHSKGNGVSERTNAPTRIHT